MLETNAKSDVLLHRLCTPSQWPQPNQPVLAYVRDGRAGISDERSLLRAHASYSVLPGKQRARTTSRAFSKFRNCLLADATVAVPNQSPSDSQPKALYTPRGSAGISEGRLPDLHSASHFRPSRKHCALAQSRAAGKSRHCRSLNGAHPSPTNRQWWSNHDGDIHAPVWLEYPRAIGLKLPTLSIWPATEASEIEPIRARH